MDEDKNKPKGFGTIALLAMGWGILLVGLACYFISIGIRP